MKIIAVIDRTESLARKGYTPAPGETVRYLAHEAFTALSEDEVNSFESIIDRTEKVVIERKKQANKK